MTILLPPREAILACLVQASRGLHAKEIAAKCSVRANAHPKLFQLLDTLSREGRVRRLPGRRYQAVAQEKGRTERPSKTLTSRRPSGRRASVEEARSQPKRGGEGWEGVLAVHPRGFGFVTAASQDDAYIAPEAIGGAMHGDRVKISVLGRSRRGLEGRIEKVLERTKPLVAGTIRRKGMNLWLEPDDARVRGPIALATQNPKSEAALDGQAALVRIVEFPESRDENPEGVLESILGTSGEMRVEVQKVLAREQIEETHPAEAIAEAKDVVRRLGRGAPGTPELGLRGRVDLRHVPLPTIDPEDARDHDDALWVDEIPEGYRVWIAIADVAEFVQPGSALDVEARKRGCTVYLPDRAVPMLPSVLAADACSLLPQQERLCLCVAAELNRRAEVVAYEVVQGVMCSAAKLTYGEVARTLGFTSHGRQNPEAERLKSGLMALASVSKKLRAVRMKRGALDLDLPDPKLELEPKTGEPLNVVRRQQDPGTRRAYSMVEEMMLLANELVASWLADYKSPAIYRVHASPDAEKLEGLANAAKILGVPFDMDEMQKPTGVAKWLNGIQGHGRKQILQWKLLTALKQAAYQVENAGHFGLASRQYLHFTSPIRRYPDIQVHRAVKRLLTGHRPDTSEEALEALSHSATIASQRERNTLDVEREVMDLYRAVLMQGKLGEVLSGMISSIGGGGVYVTLDEPFVDVLVPFEGLGPDRYELANGDLCLRGARSGEQLMPGDLIVVEIQSVTLSRRMTIARRVVSSTTQEGKVPCYGKQRSGRERRTPQQQPVQAPRASGGRQQRSRGKRSKRQTGAGGNG